MTISIAITSALETWQAEVIRLKRFFVLGSWSFVHRRRIAIACNWNCFGVKLFWIWDL